jgi:hypothetical protein
MHGTRRHNCGQVGLKITVPVNEDIDDMGYELTDTEAIQAEDLDESPVTTLQAMSIDLTPTVPQGRQLLVHRFCDEY